jgi:Rad3-related DNA helicase
MQLLEVEYFLLEDERDDYLEKTFGEKLEQTAMRDDSANARGKQAKQIIQILRNMDPSNGKFLTYLVTQYVKPDDQGNLRYRLEDTENVRNVLQKFIRYKNTLQKKDINQYSNIQELFNVIYELERRDAPAPKTKGEEEREKLEGAKLILQGPNIKIFEITTPQAAASVALKYQTNWCTLGTAHGLRYLREGELYVIVVKTPDRLRAWQFHYQSGQLMNEADAAINDRDKTLLSSFPEYIKFIDMMVQRHYTDISTLK